MRNKDELKRIMAEDEILPSSGFASSVMEAVRREAAAPPPIPFPWKRALPGAIFAATTLLIILAICARQLFTLSSVSANGTQLSAVQFLLQLQAHWVLLALGLTLVIWKFPSFLGLRRS